MTKCFDKTALPSIWMFWPQVHCYGFGYPLRRWTNFVIINVNHISNSFSLLRIHDIDLTFKATKAFVQYVSALTTLSQGINTFQYADKGGGVVFQFNSPKRSTFLFGKILLIIHKLKEYSQRVLVIKGNTECWVSANKKLFPIWGDLLKASVSNFTLLYFSQLQNLHFTILFYV